MWSINDEATRDVPETCREPAVLSNIDDFVFYQKSVIFGGSPAVTSLTDYMVRLFVYNEDHLN